MCMNDNLKASYRLILPDMFSCPTEPMNKRLMQVKRKEYGLPMSCLFWKKRFTQPGTVLENIWIDLKYKGWYGAKPFCSYLSRIVRYTETEACVSNANSDLASFNFVDSRLDFLPHLSLVLDFFKFYFIPMFNRWKKTWL